MSWDDDKIAKLKELWASGISASQIAARIGAVSRNAVISKVHREGLPGRATTSRALSSRQTKVRTDKAKKTNSKKAPEGWFALRAPLPDKPEPVVYVEAKPRVHNPEKLVTFDELEAHHCRWPVGDPRDETFRFCGETKSIGLVYCEACSEIAYRPRGEDGKPLRLRPSVTARPSNFAAGGKVEPSPHVETQESIPAAGQALVEELEEA